MNKSHQSTTGKIHILAAILLTAEARAERLVDEVARRRPAPEVRRVWAGGSLKVVGLCSGSVQALEPKWPQPYITTKLAPAVCKALAATITSALSTGKYYLNS